MYEWCNYLLLCIKVCEGIPQFEYLHIMLNIRIYIYTYYICWSLIGKRSNTAPSCAFACAHKSALLSMHLGQETTTNCQPTRDAHWPFLRRWFSQSCILWIWLGANVWKSLGLSDFRLTNGIYTNLPKADGKIPEILEFWFWPLGDESMWKAMTAPPFGGSSAWEKTVSYGSTAVHTMLN